MEAQEIFFTLLVILFSAKILAEVFAYFKLPPVLGGITAGIIIGPSLLNLVPLSEAVVFMAELGILLLLFKVGVETNLTRLLQVGLEALGVGLAGVILPFAGGFIASYCVFHLELLPSLFVGGTLTATSIGITMAVLGDMNKIDTRPARIVLSGAIIDDIVGVLILSILYQFALCKKVEFLYSLRLLGAIIVFFVLALISAKVISALIQKFDAVSRTSGTITISTIMLILLFAVISLNLGTPAILGVFMAGLAISRRFLLPFKSFKKNDEVFTSEVEVSITPLIYIFTPIFFVSVGLALNLRHINFTSPNFYLVAISLLVISFLGKFLSGFIVRGTVKEKIIVGIAMVPRGEVGLIFAELGRIHHILDNDLYAILIFVIFFTTFIAPILMRALYAEGGKKVLPPFLGQQAF